MAFVFNASRSPIEVQKNPKGDAFPSNITCQEPGHHALCFEVSRDQEELFMGGNSQIHWWAVIRIQIRRVKECGEICWIVDAVDVLKHGMGDACLRDDHYTTAPSFKSHRNGAFIGVRKTLKQAKELATSLLDMAWEVADTRVDPQLFPPDCEAMNKAYDEAHGEYFHM